MTSGIKLTPDIIYGFSGSLLSPRFHNPQPTPDFHKELWGMCCSDKTKAAAAAPRGHAKSTAVTHSYGMACIVFQLKRFIVIISNTYDQAVQFLGDIKVELKENEELIQLFKIKKIIKDTESEIIIEFDNGTQTRVIAKGSGQEIRGSKWRNMRPDLIIGDDLENDEMVRSEDQREKFRNWFFSSVVPAVSDKGEIRIVGTVLHFDSLLERVLNDSEWHTMRFAAHNEDFSEILWPEKFPKEKLIGIRNSYRNQGYPEGYSQEYLNVPISAENAYFRKEDLRFMSEDDMKSSKEYYVGVDLAISEKDRRAYTVFVVAGLDAKNILHVVDVRRGRWDSKEIIEEFFRIQTIWEPDVFFVEDEKITKSIGPFLNEEMHKQGLYLNIQTMTPTADKVQRARSIQGRIRVGGMKIDSKAYWYPDFELEVLRFPKGQYVDQVDALAWIGLGLNKMVAAYTDAEVKEMQYERDVEDADINLLGGSFICGY